MDKGDCDKDMDAHQYLITEIREDLRYIRGRVDDAVREKKG
jgi:hypothetical protein